MSGDREPRGEVWWVYSPRQEAWAGLRIAHFGVLKSLDGFVLVSEAQTPFFILGEVPHRSGIRIWENASKREGWVKVRRIDVPTHAACLAAMAVLELPADHPQDGQFRAQTGLGPMAEAAYKRPPNFNSLTGGEQYEIDKALGILDWDGDPSK